MQADSLPAEPQGKPKNTGVVAYPFSSISSRPRNSNRGLLHCRQVPYQLSSQGSPVAAVIPPAVILWAPITLLALPWQPFSRSVTAQLLGDYLLTAGTSAPRVRVTSMPGLVPGMHRHSTINHCWLKNKHHPLFLTSGGRG